MKRKRMGTEDLYVCNEVVYEILSWLPVKSLLRFKSVCKQWCSIINSPDFIDTHMNRSPGCWVYTGKTITPSSSCQERTVLSYCCGLILDVDKYSTRNLRIRNPSTRKVVELPGTSKNIVSRVKLYQLPSTREFKLVHPYVNLYNDIVGCKVLAVGTDAEWRSVAFPFPYKTTHVRIETIILQGIYYIICLPISSSNPEHDPKIACLDLQKETFFTVDIPWNLFPGWTDVYAMSWEGKLSLGSVQQEKVQIWVLENYREHKWAQRKIAIQWPSMYENQVWLYAVPRISRNNQLVINLDSEMLISVDIASGKLVARERAPIGRKFFSYQVPTLLHVKGMRTESQTIRAKSH